MEELEPIIPFGLLIELPICIAEVNLLGITCEATGRGP